MESLQRLTALGTPSLADDLSSDEAVSRCEELGILPLTELYTQRNGMFAFESALHIFPITPTDKSYTLQQWNDPTLWKPRYRNAESITFFAQNIFGEPYGLEGESVVWLDLETGTIKTKAPSVEEWARRILADYRVETGYPLAHEWQIRNRPLKMTERLVPIHLLSLGGSYKPENFNALNLFDGIDFRATIYEQTRDLPKGTPIKFVKDTQESGMQQLRVRVVSEKQETD